MITWHRYSSQGLLGRVLDTTSGTKHPSGVTFKSLHESTEVPTKLSHYKIIPLLGDAATVRGYLEYPPQDRLCQRTLVDDDAPSAEVLA